MVMNPRTHPKGIKPDFALPKPNPNPTRMTDALWWLVCMREALEPKLSANGGTFANKPGFHNVGDNLPDHGLGNAKTDHSIRHTPNRTGPWWKTKTSAHDWTFHDAQRGDFTTIKKYTNRLISSMRSLTDLRPDNVYWYTLGQGDNDRVVEGWHENTDEILGSSDETHLWHRHDSFRRNIIGSFPHMWQALTIDMGWTYAEWQRSIAPAPIEEYDVDNATLNAIADRVVDKLLGADVLAGASGFEYTGQPGPDGTLTPKTALERSNLVTAGLYDERENLRKLLALPAEVEALKARLAALSQDPAGMSDPEAHELVKVLRYVEVHPTTES